MNHSLLSRLNCSKSSKTRSRSCSAKKRLRHLISRGDRILGNREKVTESKLFRIKRRRVKRLHNSLNNIMHSAQNSLFKPPSQLKAGNLLNEQIVLPSEEEIYFVKQTIQAPEKPISKVSFSISEFQSVVVVYTNYDNQTSFQTKLFLDNPFEEASIKSRSRSEHLKTRKVQPQIETFMSDKIPIPKLLDCKLVTSRTDLSLKMEVNHPILYFRFVCKSKTPLDCQFWIKNKENLIFEQLRQRGRHYVFKNTKKAVNIDGYGFSEKGYFDLLVKELNKMHQQNLDKDIERKKNKIDFLILNKKKNTDSQYREKENKHQKSFFMKMRTRVKEQKQKKERLEQEKKTNKMKDILIVKQAELRLQRYIKYNKSLKNKINLIKKASWIILIKFLQVTDIISEKVWLRKSEYIRIKHKNRKIKHIYQFYLNFANKNYRKATNTGLYQLEANDLIRAKNILRVNCIFSQSKVIKNSKSTIGKWLGNIVPILHLRDLTYKTHYLSKYFTLINTSIQNC